MLSHALTPEDGQELAILLEFARSLRLPIRAQRRNGSQPATSFAFRTSPRSLKGSWMLSTKGCDVAGSSKVVSTPFKRRPKRLRRGHVHLCVRGEVVVAHLRGLFV